MDNKPRDIEDINADFSNKFALVLGVIDMVGILNDRIEELDNRTMQGLFIALYYEALKIEELYHEARDLPKQ